MSRQRSNRSAKLWNKEQRLQLIKQRHCELIGRARRQTEEDLSFEDGPLFDEDYEVAELQLYESYAMDIR